MAIRLYSELCCVHNVNDSNQLCMLADGLILNDAN